MSQDAVDQTEPAPGDPVDEELERTEFADQPVDEGHEASATGDTAAEQPEDEESGERDGHGREPAADPSDGSPRSPAGRRLAFALVRSVVVIGVAAVGYQLVVPQTHTVRARLAQLVTPSPGVSGYTHKVATSEAIPVTQIGLPSLTAATKTAPNKTGVYGTYWQVASAKGGYIVALMLPDAQQAQATLKQLATNSLSANAQDQSGFTRKSTYKVPSLPSGQAALYTSPGAAGTSTPPAELTEIVYTHGRTVVLAQANDLKGSQAETLTLANAEQSHLAAIGGGVNLEQTTYSSTETILWAAGTVVLVALIGFGPYGWRARARRRERKWEAELAQQVVVGSRVIHKHRV